MSSVLVLEIDKDELKSIAQRIARDGLRSDLSDEQKLRYIWRLSARCEHSLKSSLDDVEQLRNQQRKEMLEVESYMSYIRHLSEQQKLLMVEYEQENEQLRADLSATKKDLQTVAETVESCNQLFKCSGMDISAGPRLEDQFVYLLSQYKSAQDQLKIVLSKNALLEQQSAAIELEMKTYIDNDFPVTIKVRNLFETAREKQEEINSLTSELTCLRRSTEEQFLELQKIHHSFSSFKTFPREMALSDQAVIIADEFAAALSHRAVLENALNAVNIFLAEENGMGFTCDPETSGGIPPLLAELRSKWCCMKSELSSIGSQVAQLQAELSQKNQIAQAISLSLMSADFDVTEDIQRDVSNFVSLYKCTLKNRNNLEVLVMQNHALIGNVATGSEHTGPVFDQPLSAVDLNTRSDQGVDRCMMCQNVEDLERSVDLLNEKLRQQNVYIQLVNENHAKEIEDRCSTYEKSLEALRRRLFDAQLSLKDAEEKSVASQAKISDMKILVDTLTSQKNVLLSQLVELKRQLTLKPAGVALLQSQHRQITTKLLREHKIADEAHKEVIMKLKAQLCLLVSELHNQKHRSVNSQERSNKLRRSLSLSAIDLRRSKDMQDLLIHCKNDAAEDQKSSLEGCVVVLGALRSANKVLSDKLEALENAFATQSRELETLKIESSAKDERLSTEQEVYVNMELSCKKQIWVLQDVVAKQKQKLAYYKSYSKKTAKRCDKDESEAVKDDEYLFVLTGNESPRIKHDLDEGKWRAENCSLRQTLKAAIREIKTL